jgi:hypothetical protein
MTNTTEVRRSAIGIKDGDAEAFNKLFEHQVDWRCKMNFKGEWCKHPHDQSKTVILMDGGDIEGFLKWFKSRPGFKMY